MKSLLAMLLLAVGVSATEPGLELRLRPAADFVSQFEYIGKLIGQAEQAKQFADVVDAFGGKKGVIEGLDLKRPVGAYVVFTPGLADSQIVVMLPLANEKAFINLLTNRLSITPEKQDDGVYFMQAPKVAPPLYFRFHKDYVCLTVQEPKNIAADKLIDPKTFFAGDEPAMVALKLHVDKLPAEVRKQFVGQLELGLHDKLDKAGTAAERFGNWLVLDGAMRGIKAVAEEGKTLTVKLFSSPKTDDLGATVTLTGKDGSDLTKTFAGLVSKPAHAALVAAAKAPVVSFALNAGLPAAMKKELDKHIDEMINEAVQNAGDGKEVLEKALETLMPTLKAGDYELGAAITGGGPGEYRVLAAARTVDGKDLEKLIKEFSGFLPPEVAKLEFDDIKTSTGNLHKITTGDEDLKRLYGSPRAWAMLSNTLYILSLEPDGAAAKRVAEATPGTSPILAAKVAVTRLLPMTEMPHNAEGHAKTVKAVFGGSVADGADEAAFTIVGGSELTIKLTVKGKVLQFLTETDKRKKAKE